MIPKSGNRFSEKIMRQYAFYRPEEIPMKPTISALAVAALVAAAMPSSAQARCDGCAIGAGVLGGLAAGAIIGSAISQPRYVEPAPIYAAPAYAEPPEYVDGPVCHMERQRIWVEGYGWRLRRMEVCE
jgi:hypothetical protein